MAYRKRYRSRRRMTMKRPIRRRRVRALRVGFRM